MTQAIGSVALLVREYDEAIRWFVDVLGFALVEDRDLGDGKRWVLVAPPGPPGTALLLARAVTPEQVAAVGNQSGGRVFLFLHTDDFVRDHAAMRERGVRFVEEPRTEPYGTVAVFEDLYGNRWDLVGLRTPSFLRAGSSAALRAGSPREIPSADSGQALRQAQDDDGDSRSRTSLPGRNCDNRRHAAERTGPVRTR